MQAQNNMIRKFTFCVGLNDNDTKKQEITTAAALEILEELCFSYFDGATLTACRGLYKHENGAKVRENSYRIEVLFFDDNAETTAAAFVADVKKALNQETIALQRELVDSELV